MIKAELKLVVFGYNFPHWKTQTGLLNLVAHGLRPDWVVLQDKKVLNVPHSEYRITPEAEYLLDPKQVCLALGLRYAVHDHADFCWPGELGVVLGARILPGHVIARFEQGILNLHPGILPGNRGLDNLKHSIVRGLPIGVTAHFIDDRVDMGRIIATREVKVTAGDSIRDVYLKQRNLEQELMVETVRRCRDGGVESTPCEPSEKFTVIDPLDDALLGFHWISWKHKQGIEPQRRGDAEEVAA